MVWDNYDELNESLVLEKQTTNDTQGVVFQNKKPEGAPSPPEQPALTSQGASLAMYVCMYEGKPIELTPIVSAKGL